MGLIVEKIITKSFARLMGRGIHRGFITHEELFKSLGKRNLSEENLSEAFIHILNEKIFLVEQKSDFKALKKKDRPSKEDGKVSEKSDDPIRMYLREMGGVEEYDYLVINDVFEHAIEELHKMVINKGFKDHKHDKKLKILQDLLS